MKIANLDKMRIKKALSNKNVRLRKIDDHYEYSLLPYEDYFRDFSMHSVQIGDIFANILSDAAGMHLVGFLFPIKKYNPSSISEWVKSYDLFWQDEQIEEVHLYNAERIVESLLLYGKPLIMYERGNQSINLKTAKMHEISDEYSSYTLKTNLRRAKMVDSDGENKGLHIKINGLPIENMPRIDFARNDRVFSNGNYLPADYFGEYHGWPAFFRKDCDIPISIIADVEAQIEIEMLEHPGTGSKLYIFEFNYEFMPDDLDWFRKE